MPSNILKLLIRYVEGDKRDCMLLYLCGGAGGVDHHDDEGHYGERSKDNAYYVGHDLEAPVAGFKSSFHYLLPPFLSRIRKNTTTEQAALIRNIIMDAAAARLYI